MASSGVEKFLSSLPDIHVSHSQLLVRDSQKKTNGIFGLTSQESSKRSSQLSLFSKTSKDTSTVDSKKSYKRFPQWGSMRNGVFTQHHKPDLHKEETESSSWPTPNSSLRNDTEDALTFNKRAAFWKKEKGYHNSKPLEIKVKEWPTPTSMDGLRTGKEGDYEAWTKARDRHKKVGVNKHFHLNAATSKWPTPGANDHKGSSKVGQRRGQLDEAAEQKYLVSHRGLKKTGATSQKSCGQRWPTPKVSDDNTDRRGTASKQRHKERLNSSRDLPVDATLFKNPTKENRRLNPLFVEWLQGFPIGWTDLER
jgi:hypothetical protein